MRCRAGLVPVILLLFLFAAGGALAGDLVVGAGSVVANGAIAEAHGWVVLDKPEGEGVVLAHLPPRHGAVHGGYRGVARLSRVFENPPEAIAGDGRRVYFVFAGSPRRVLSIDAVPTSVDGIWRDTPEGRLTPHNHLPAGGTLLGLAVASGRLTVLIGDEDGPRLLEMVGDGWREADLPPEAERDGRWGLAGDAKGLVLVRLDGGPPSLWRRGEEGWRAEPFDIADGSVLVGVFRGRAVLLSPEAERPERLAVVLAGGRGVSTIAAVDRPASIKRVGVVVLPDQTGRLAMVWLAGDGGGAAHHIREISLSTGRVLYEGPVERVTPVSAEEFRLLAVGLVLIVVVSLFVVLRPIDDRAPVVLPEGTALASPGRRFVATAIDVLVCALPVSMVMDVPVSQIVTGAVLIGPGPEWIAIPAVFGVGVVYGTLFESLFSATVGKLLMGCRVVRCSGRVGVKPGLGACFVRNLIKWVLPPVTSLAMLEPSGRHRGDMIARALVVVPIENA